MRTAARGPGDRGQSTVELALLLPVVLVVILTVVQVGLLGRDVVLVTHAAREAARAAAVDPTPGAARRAALASSSLRDERLSVSVTGRTGASGRVRVTLTYRVQMRVPLVGSLLGDHRIRASATMRVEAPAPSRSARIRANRSAVARSLKKSVQISVSVGGSGRSGSEPIRQVEGGKRPIRHEEWFRYAPFC